jgi:polygalacturonase
MMIWRAPFVFGILLALSSNALGHASDRSAIFNVRNYGAKGDATTDDSVAIASAAAAAAVTAANGRPSSLYFPSGVCRLAWALAATTRTDWMAH